MATVVGERGVTLSGGQKQRLSLARALAADRPALVLDDTLSAVDQETERRILDRLARTQAGRTLMVATHRLSAVRHAHVILVLHRGGILEHGTHEELIANQGPYAQTWRLQQEQQALGGGR